MSPLTGLELRPLGRPAYSQSLYNVVLPCFRAHILASWLLFHNKTRRCYAVTYNNWGCSTSHASARGDCLGLLASELELFSTLD
jgi:hypothetical protein